MFFVRLRGLRDTEHSFKEYRDALAYATGKVDTWIKSFHGQLVSRTKNYWKVVTPEGPLSVFIIELVS